MAASRDLLAGIYRHYKGPLYLVLGLAHDANRADREVVVYVPLQLDGAHTGPRLAVRTREDFDAMVCTVRACHRFGLPGVGLPTNDCATAHYGERFTYVGATWDGGTRA